MGRELGFQDDPKSFAAMRYTESRLTSYASILLGELDQAQPIGCPTSTVLLKPKFCRKGPKYLTQWCKWNRCGNGDRHPSPQHKRSCELQLNYSIHLEHRSQVFVKICSSRLSTNAEIITPRNEILSIYESGRGQQR